MITNEYQIEDRGIRIKKIHIVFFTSVLFITYNLLLIIGNSNSNELTILNIILLFVLFVFAIISAYKDLNNIILLLFYVSLFNFQFSYIFISSLIGREYWIISEYFGETVYSSFTSINQVLFIIGSSLIVIHFTLVRYYLRFKKKIIECNNITYNCVNLKNIQKISRFLSIITSPFAIYFLFKQVLYVTMHGYQSYFLSSYNDMGINWITSQLETMFRVSIAIYFATYPNHRSIRTPLIIYILYTLMYLGTGDRTNTAVLFMMLIWYFSEHKKRYPEFRRNRISQNLKGKITIVLSAFALLWIFSVWNEVRYSFGTGRHVNIFNSNVMPLIEFLISQGRSYNTILKGILINNNSILSISDRCIMLLQPLLHQLEGMSFSIIHFEFLHKMGGFEFTKIPSSADLISIFVNANIYLNGGGLGSSYLAEGVLLCGYIGTIITSLIVAQIIVFASYKSNKNFWHHSFVIFSFIFIMRFPRDLTFGIFSFLVPFFIRAILIFFVSIILSGSSKKKLYVKGGK